MRPDIAATDALADSLARLLPALEAFTRFEVRPGGAAHGLARGPRRAAARVRGGTRGGARCAALSRHRERAQDRRSGLLGLGHDDADDGAGSRTARGRDRGGAALVGDTRQLSRGPRAALAPTPRRVARSLRRRVHERGRDGEPCRPRRRPPACRRDSRLRSRASTASNARRAAHLCVDRGASRRPPRLRRSRARPPGAAHDSGRREEDSRPLGARARPRRGPRGGPHARRRRRVRRRREHRRRGADRRDARDRHARRVWLHVDGAYGGFGVLDPRVKPLYGDLSKIDSFAVDPHKWMAVPVGCGAAFVRDGGLLARALTLEPAAYVEMAPTGTGDLGSPFDERGEGTPTIPSTTRRRRAASRCGPRSRRWARPACARASSATTTARAASPRA